MIQERSMRRMSCLTVVSALLALGAASAADASDKVGTHREQAARRYCWKRIGLDPDEDPSRHQAERLKPCVKKRLGYDDPYMDQF
jgi:hypothetical protein